MASGVDVIGVARDAARVRGKLTSHGAQPRFFEFGVSTCFNTASLGFRGLV